MATSKVALDSESENTSKPTQAAKPKCGIIMPIAGFGAYTESHWNDVLRIIRRAAEAAEFESAMVSTGADVGVIHANIINNIYSNEIVVCDVSGKNANVMFELGLRLASKLPVIIIKDELTGYSFDTSPIQHLSYRSDLRLFETMAFQEDLTRHISSTYANSLKPNYKTFLDHFGNYTLSKVEDKSVDLNYFLNAIFSRLEAIEQRQANSSITDVTYKESSSKPIRVGKIFYSGALVDFIEREVIRQGVAYPLTTVEATKLYDAVTNRFPKLLVESTASNLADLINAVVKKYFRITS